MAGLPEFERWSQVSGHIPPADRLFRSSSPNYTSVEDGHSLTDKGIEILKANKIEHVISLNSKAVSNTAIKAKLDKSGIAYTPLPVPDFSAPTAEQLATGNTNYRKHRKGTLVWCGYGYGRTGTMITGLQIYAEKDNTSPKKLTHTDYKNNHVEERNPITNKSTGQFEVLDKLQ